MLINLLHHLCGTRVKCSAISSDGYSPDNLCSGNLLQRNNGFLAAHFIKPPVDLLFQLPFPINIESITIKPKVGSQVSCGIDVFVAGVVCSAVELNNRRIDYKTTCSRNTTSSDRSKLRKRSSSPDSLSRKRPSSSKTSPSRKQCHSPGRERSHSSAKSSTGSCEKNCCEKNRAPKPLRSIRDRSRSPTTTSRKRWHSPARTGKEGISSKHGPRFERYDSPNQARQKKSPSPGGDNRKRSCSAGKAVIEGVNSMRHETSWERNPSATRAGHKRSPSPCRRRREDSSVLKMEDGTEKHEILHKYTTAVTPESFRKEHFHLFTLVSRNYESQGRNSVLINQKFQERPPLENNTTRVLQDNDFVKELFHVHSLNYVTHIIVRITKVCGSSVPAIGKIEVIGQVSAACWQEFGQLALEMYNGINQCSTPSNRPQTQKSDNEHLPLARSSENLECDIPIPEEFLDPLTFTLMTIPILLPSGLNIDTTTLDKHIEAEQQWGRLPNDPFTGKIFTDTLKPVPNGALKARIDKFILLSGIDVTGKGRSVGRADNCHRNSSAKEVFNSAITRRRSLSRETKQQARVEYEQFKGATCAISEVEGDKTDNVLSITRTHEDNLSVSLDSALRATLSGLGRFTTQRELGSTTALLQRDTPRSNDLVTKLQPNTRRASGNTNSSVTNQDTPNCCVLCHNSLASKPTFQISCQHLMCRACVTGNNACTLCGTLFGCSDIVRVHVQ